MANKRKSPYDRAPSPRTRSPRATSRGSRGCLFWAVLAVVFLSVAVAARKPLEDAFVKLLGKKHPAAPTVVVKPGPAPVENSAPGSGAAAEGKGAAQGRGATDGSRPAEQPGGQKPPSAERPAPATPEKPAVRKTRLFFATVGKDGSIGLKGVIRPIPASDSPLRDTIESLLSGPTSQEVNQGLLSMVPSGARLRSIAVRGDTAVIDFSESFRFGTLGREGLNTQLEQIVYSATDFPSVKRVQVLIEGKRVQYLGPEGIRIDAPLTRDSFQGEAANPLK